MLRRFIIEQQENLNKFNIKNIYKLMKVDGKDYENEDDKENEDFENILSNQNESLNSEKDLEGHEM